jgi:predicted deacylase
VAYLGITYPMLKFYTGERLKSFNIVVQAGIHGDETDAVKVLVKWLQEIKEEHLKQANFTVFPCLNPYGYQYGSRSNGDKLGVNVHLNSPNIKNIQELTLLKTHYPKVVDLFIDLHGDCGKYGKEAIYAYERIPKGAESPTKHAFLKNKEFIPYLTSETIYKEPCKDGVIYDPIRDESIQDYMSDNGCECALTLEVPGRLKGINQISGSVRVVHDIIEFFFAFKKQGKI